MTIVLVRGIGDIGSAVGHLLFREGYGVVVHDDPRPTTTRRGMAFADAAFDGQAELDGVGAVRARDLVPNGDSMFTRLWNHGVDLYVRDLHYRAYRNMSAADRIHPGFPDVERVREDCDIKHKEQGYLHREEFQWALMGTLLLGGIAGVWFGGRRAMFATRQGIRSIVREELDARDEQSGR